jgi:hypothetical protein
MTLVHGKYESTPPKTDDSGDLGTGGADPGDEYIAQLNDLEGGSGSQGSGGVFGDSGESTFIPGDGSGDSSGGVPQTADDMRSYLLDLRNSGQITQSEYTKYLKQVNAAVGLSPSGMQTAFTKICGDISAKQTANTGGGDSSGTGDVTGDGGDGSGTGDQPPEVSRGDIKTLLNEVQNGTVKPQDGGTLSQSDILKILNQALRDEDAGKTGNAASEYAQVVEALGGQEAIDPKTLAEKSLGETPTSIDSDGTIHFDGHDENGNPELSLKAPGDSSKVVVDNATEVTLTPKNSGDPVTVSEEGNYYVIQMGNDTFKINKDANINIISDHVTGTVDSKDSHITVGASESTSTTLANQNAQADLGNKLAGAADKIGSVTYTTDQDPSTSPFGSGLVGGGGYGMGTMGMMTSPFNTKANSQGFTYGVGWHGDNAYKGPGSEQEAADEAKKAKEVIGLMADALNEKDPSKRSDKWDQVFDAMSRIMNEDTEGGHINNIGQLIFNVVYGELGEEGFKNALQQGLIPSNIANKLGELLNAKPEENSDMTNEITTYQIGGPNMTHGDSIDFLNHYGGVVTSPPSSSSST